MVMKLKIENLDKMDGMERGKYEVDITVETLDSYRFYIRDNEIRRGFQIDLMKESREGGLIWELRYSPTKIKGVSWGTISNMNLLLSDIAHLISVYRKPLPHKNKP
jgi:hypothetical protein